MKILQAILDRMSGVSQVIVNRRKRIKIHKIREEKHVVNHSKPIYYIIRYEDGMSCGWSVWERVVLYGSIYAADHKMIPVVDMQTRKNIYLEDDEVGHINAWEKYYMPPGGITLENALKSENYILADDSQEWFVHIRQRNPRRFTTEYLREQYSKYIRLQNWVINRCEANLLTLIPDYDEKTKMLGICIRGTDYLLFHHPVQPEIEDVALEAAKLFDKLRCNYYFVATEDYEIFRKLCEALPDGARVISYKAGGIKKATGLIGEQIRKEKSAEEASLDYLTILYGLNKCVGLIGGKCGATIVAEYRKNPPYEYIHIADLNRGF